MAAHMRGFNLLFLNSNSRLFMGRKCLSSSYYHTVVGRTFNVKHGKSAEVPFRRCSSVVPCYTQSKYSGSRKNGTYWALTIPLFLKKFLGIEEEETPEETLVRHIKMSILFIQREEYQKAEQLLHITLKMAHDQRNENGITYIYDILANLAFDTNDYKKAETLFISVMQRLLTSGVQEDDLKIIHIALKLAKIYEELGDVNKSQLGYEFCQEKLHVKDGEADDDRLKLWVMTLYWYAQFLIQRNKPVEALKHLNAAYDTSVTVYGYDHAHTVELLSDMGRASSLKGDHDGAANYFERAIKVAQSLEEVPPISHVMTNLGMTNFFLQLYEEGIRWCEMGKKQAKVEENGQCYSEATECLKKLKTAMVN